MTEEKLPRLWERLTSKRGSVGESEDAPISDQDQLLRTLGQLSEQFEAQQSVAARTVQVLGPMPALVEQQTRHLEEIRNQLGRMTQGNEMLISAIDALSRAARDQTDKMGAIEDHLVSNDQAARTLDCTETLGREMASLVKLTEDQQKILKNISAQSHQQLDLVRAHLARDERASRFQKIFLAALVFFALVCTTAMIMAAVALAKVL